MLALTYPYGQGILRFTWLWCLSFDKGGVYYLKYLCGPAAFAVHDDVRKLPLKTADIYRKLTI